MKNLSDFEMPTVLSDFLSYMQTIRGKSPNTVLSYFYDLRVFLRFIKIHKKFINNDSEFNNINIADIELSFIRNITLSDLYAFMAFVSNNRDNSSYSRARKVACLKSFFKYLSVKAKLIEFNPASEFESPKILKRLPRYLNIEESKQLLTSVEGIHLERDLAIITMFLNCGLRLSELVGINLNNIKGTMLTVIGKGDKERGIPLNNACIKVLEDYMRVRPTNAVKDRNALFISDQKRRISKESVQKIVKKYIKAAGLDPERYSTHKLRHTAATLMYKYGNVDIRALQELLGHESISTTQIYTHLDSKQLKNAVDSNPLANFDNKK
jgi:integrase/recombinase XerD